ncbi:MAG: VCBS domain-containing protein, partial [Alsobacter sp.]
MYRLDESRGGAPNGKPLVIEAKHGPGANAIVVPDAHLLFTAHFARSGVDLVLTGQDGRKVVIADYFLGDRHPDLVSPNGGLLSASVVESLVGPLAPGEVAQNAGAPQGGAPAIGRVEAMSGDASVVRNGVVIALNVGDLVLKGDVAQTGAASTLAITFIDGTVFNLSPASRMVLSEMVYSEGGSDNQSLLSVVQGSVSFLAGQVAKTGSMRVDTPAATLGIRGTAVLIDLSSIDGVARFSVMTESNGRVGSFQVLDRVTGAVRATVDNPQLIFVVSSTSVEQVQKQPADLQYENSLIAFLTPLAIIPQIQQNPGDQQNGPLNNPNPQAGNGGSPGSSGSVNDIGNAGDAGSTEKAAALESSLLSPQIGVQPTVTVLVINDQGGATVTPPAPVETVVPNALGSSTTISVVPINDVQASVSQLTSFTIANQIVVQNPTTTFQAIVPNSISIVVTSQPTVIPAGTNLSNLVQISDPVTGQVSYDKGAFAFLAQGETVVYTVNFSSLVEGQVIQESLTLTIAGTNDAPVLTPTSATTASVVEPALAGQVVTATGTMQFTDLDNNDLHAVTVVPGAGAVGTLTVTGLSNSTTTTPGQVAWTFSIDKAAADAVPAGQTIVETFTIILLDNHGGTSTQQVTVSITGVNDAATITGPATGTVVEDGVLTAGGTLVVTDPDPGQSTFQTPASLAGTYGTFTFDAATGVWGYTLNNAAANVQALVTGQQVTDTLTVTSADGSASQAIVVTINGANDAAVIGGATTGSLTESTV